MATACLQKHLNFANIVFLCLFLFFPVTLGSKLFYFEALPKVNIAGCFLHVRTSATTPKSLLTSPSPISLSTARPPHPSHLSVCGGHVLGRRGPPGPAGVPADVPQPAPAQRTGGPHHVRTHGSGSRAQLRRGGQELRVQGNQRPELQADPGERRRPGCFFSDLSIMQMT